MVYKVLRFLGAVALAWIFSFLASVFHTLFFAGTAHFFANISWSNWLSFDIFRGFLLPIAWSILWLIGAGLVALVRGNKIIAALPIICFILQTIHLVDVLFIHPIEPIVDEIGQGFWYYFGAVVTFGEILASFGICTVCMFVYDD